MPQVISSKGDILISCKGTIGELLINDFGDIHIARQFMAIRTLSHNIESAYLLIVMEWSLRTIKEQSKGIIPGISRPVLLELNIPIPPYSEQERIVKQFNKYSSFLGPIAENMVNLKDRIFQIKSKILDFAMQGKLVPQDPTDEPAADMLLRINPKAKIITDNPHYPQLPDNWVYVSLEDINDYRSKLITPNNNPEKQFELYSVPAYHTGVPEILKGKEIGSSKQLVMMGDILVCKINPHLKRVWRINNQSLIRLHRQNGLLYAIQK